MRDVRPRVQGHREGHEEGLLSAAIFSLIVYTILPIGLVGGVGAESVEAYDYVGA